MTADPLQEWAYEVGADVQYGSENADGDREWSVTLPEGVDARVQAVVKARGVRHVLGGSNVAGTYRLVKESGADALDIEIPFNDWSTERHLRGEKTATTRTERYGDPGDRFADEAADAVFELTHVVRLPLGVVANQFHDVEGAASEEEFMAIWEDIHPRRGFDPQWMVYLHLYRGVDADA